MSKPRMSISKWTEMMAAFPDFAAWDDQDFLSALANRWGKLDGDTVERAVARWRAARSEEKKP